MWYNIVSVLYLFIYFSPPQVMWILVPQPGIEPSSPALESKVSTMDHQRSSSHQF